MSIQYVIATELQWTRSRSLRRLFFYKKFTSSCAMCVFWEFRLTDYPTSLSLHDSSYIFKLSVWSILVCFSNRHSSSITGLWDFFLNFTLLKAFDKDKNAFSFFFHRILWWWSECYHCVHSMLLARQQSNWLQLCHGKSFPVSDTWAMWQSLLS